MPQYAAAIDQGTTGTRFMLFDREGQAIASMYEKHTQIYSFVIFDLDVASMF